MAGVASLIILIFRWFAEPGGFGSRKVPFVTFGFAFFVFISGLVNVVKGWDRSGGKDIS